VSWTSLFDDLPREHGYEPLRVEGSLPDDLRGTLYRCGPALFSRAGHPYRHTFDGDGAVTAVRFAGGVAHGAVRIVDTPGLVEERAAGRALHPAYGTLPPGPPRPLPRPKHAANINVVASQDRILALHEAGAPIALSHDLVTLGEDVLGEPSIGQGFSAHPHATRGALYNIGVHYGRTTVLSLYDLRGRAARKLASLPLAGATMVHDFAVTERHLVVFAPPLRLDLRGFATGLLSYSDALAWRPELGTEVIVIPLDDPEASVRFTTDAFFQWHLASARETRDGIVVDVVRYPDFESNRWIGGLVRGEQHAFAHGRLARARIDLARRTLQMEPVCDASIEFPVPSVRDADHVFAVAHAPGSPHGLYDRVIRIDARTGMAREHVLGADQFPSEPIVIAGRDRDWLLTLVYDAQAHASHVAVLDADDLVVVARAWFDHHIPFTLHGTWFASG
jgi:carotenoid cleavage dioxygenase-like enzyme